MSVHQINYKFLMDQGEMVVPFEEMVVLVRKLDLEGLDYFCEKKSHGWYQIEVY